MNRIITCDPRENHLLCSLTKSELEQLIPDLELVAMSAAEVVFDINEKVQYIDFPISATASLLCCLEDGSSVEVAMVGNEGIPGISALLGGDKSTLEVIINQTGQALSDIP